jgi:hypothetical protein
MDPEGKLAVELPADDAFKDLKTPKRATDAAQLSPEQSAKQKRLYKNAQATTTRNYEKIAKLVEASSTQPQRNHYTKVTGQKWHDVFFLPFRSASLDEFQRQRKDISDIEREESFKHRPSLSDGVRKELRKTIWKAVESSRLGRFQRAFSLVNQRCVPLNYSQLKRKQLNSYPLTGCLVAPERVPNHLALRIDPSIFAGDKVTPEQALRRKTAPGFIQGLKRLFESAHGLPGTQQRIQVIGEPEPNINGCYADAPPWNHELTGAFIRYRGDISTEDRQFGPNAKKPQSRELIIPIYEDIDALLRASLHIGAGYRNETGEIGDLMTDCQELIQYIDSQWKRDTPQQVREEIKGEIAHFIHKATGQLKDSKSDVKGEALQFITEIDAALAKKHEESTKETPEAKRTREDIVIKNIGAVLSKLVGVENRVTERSDQIPEKSATNEADLNSIRLLQAKQNRVFINLLNSLRKAPEILGNETARKLFDSDPAPTKNLQDTYAKTLMRQLYLHPYRLNGVTTRPMLTFARKLRDVMSSLEESVYAGDRKSTEVALNKILVITQLQRANATIAKMKEIIAINDGGVIEKCKAESAKLLQELHPPEGFPIRETGAYDTVFNEMIDQIERMDRRFDYYLSSKEKELTDFSQLREFLDQPPFQLEKLVQGVE